MRRLRILPWVAVVSVLLIVGLNVTLNVLAGDYGEAWGIALVAMTAVVASLAVGLLLTVRSSGHVLGWLLLANAVLLSLVALGDSYGRYAVLANPGALPGADWAVLWGDASWPMLFVGVAAIAFLFPDGHLPSPRWRTIAVVGVASFGLMLSLAPFSPEPFGAPFRSVASPLASLPKSIYGPASAIALTGMAATLVGGALALRARFRRSAGIERLQIKWLALAAAVIPATLVACIIEGLLTGEVGAATLIGLGLFLIAVPAAIALAILRYRLYEVDRLISRTIAYLVLSVLLAIAYAAVTVTLGVLAGVGSAVPTAAATLAVALAFRPLRGRVQANVDRRFDRARYEGLHKVNRFLDELRMGQVAPEAVGGALADALSDPAVKLFFWLPQAATYADAEGHPVGELPNEPAARTPVRRGDLPLGMLLHDPALAQRPNLLDGVIAAAGLAIEIARLRVEVRNQLAEVEASRARIVTATYEERRRLERDLHDGAQQRLVTIGLALRHLQNELSPRTRGAEASLDRIVDDLAEAIKELRELARGVRPAALEDGLGDALRELASRAPLATEIEVTNERFETSTEAAAYFVASEALTNSVKHSQGSRVALRAYRLNGRLVLSVSDDGIGGARCSPGSGLAGLSDRVAALGGRLELRSELGAGTSVIAELPCE